LRQRIDELLGSSAASIGDQVQISGGSRSDIEVQVVCMEERAIESRSLHILSLEASRQSRGYIPDWVLQCVSSRRVGGS